jgi:putative ABC transport system ATP-binding protein
MIRLHNLERSYPLSHGKFFYVLRDIDIEITEGEFVSVMGPSGAGKSTLLHILGMHDHGWSGEYFFNETAVHHLKAKERAALRNEQIGFVFQQYHLLDDLTVYENLEIPLSYRKVGKGERSAIVADALDFRWWQRKICIRASFLAANSNSSALRARSLPTRN